MACLVALGHLTSSGCPVQPAPGKYEPSALTAPMSWVHTTDNFLSVICAVPYEGAERALLPRKVSTPGISV